jgi:acyl-CoA reductase-like NAD-dependent aldehyde dehydrogenase
VNKPTAILPAEAYRSALSPVSANSSSAAGAYRFIVETAAGDVRNQGPTMDVTEHHPFGVVASIIPFNWPPIHTAVKAAR